MDRNRKTKYFTLFITFLKVSTFTFAGGLAMLPAIKRDLVEKYEIISEDDFMEYATLSQTLPGVIALNCASLVGKHAAGLPGMAAASIGAILPAFALMLVATIFSQMIPQNGPLVGAMRAIRAASAGLVLSAAFSLGNYNLKDTFSTVLMIGALTAVIAGGISAPIIVVFAGCAGYIYKKIQRKRCSEDTDAD